MLREEIISETETIRIGLNHDEVKVFCLCCHNYEWYRGYVSGEDRVWECPKCNHSLPDEKMNCELPPMD